MTSSIPTIALVGVGGFGRHHLDNIARLVGLGKVRLAGLISRSGIGQLAGLSEPDVLALASTVPVFPTLDDYLAAAGVPTVVVISSPIQAHTGLALTALRAGAHVLLEKPPAPSLAEFGRLGAASAQTGRAVQVGFQSFGSQALPRLAQLIDSGALGRIRGVGAIGTWSRSEAYFTRSTWAGKRQLDGQPVVDGVITNPLAHAVATALKVVGSTRIDHVSRVSLDLYRANAIDCDDTSAVKVLTDRGIPITAGLTLAAAAESPPRVIVWGSRGSATLWYVSDQLDLDLDGQRSTEHYGRTNLTENLLDHLADPAVDLLCPLVDTGAFTQVLEAVRCAPDPRRIDQRFVRWQDHDGSRWAVVDQVEFWCERAASEAATFAELGAPWAACT